MKLVVFIFLFLNISFAQNRNEQSITSNAKTILIELESLNNLELKSIKKSREVKVTCTKCNLTTIPKLSEKDKVISIKVSSDKNELYGAQRNKFRAGQPEYPNYIIEVPENKDVKILYNKGNFSTKQFIGNIDISLNHGRLNLVNIMGNVSVISFSGVINCILKEGFIKVENSKGKTINQLKDAKLSFKSNNLIGSYKSNKNMLTIKTIHAKVELSTVITQ